MDWSLIAQSSNVPQAHRARSRAKTDTIQIDDVRALQQRLSETSTTGLRLLLIRSLERLHPTAANAMLHLLEEPPPRTVILCTTQAFNAVLPTVRSRMRHLTFHPLPARDLAPLVSHLPGSDSSFLLTYSQGAPGILLTLARDPDELRRQRQLASVAERLLTSDDPYESLTTLLPLKVREEASVLTHVLLTLRARLQLHGLDPCHLLGLRAALELLRCLQTNVQRELLLQRFVGQLAAAKMRVS